MKALTVRNPWAWAILHAGKRVENRTRRTSHRGPLLIHAGRVVEPLAVYPDGQTVPAEATVGPGAVIGIVDVMDCVEVHDLYNGYRDSPWATGPWCWVLANPRAFDVAVPFAGMPGLFSVPDELLPVR